MKKIRKTKKSSPQKREVTLFCTVAILFTALIILSVSMVITIRNSGLFTENIPINLDRITSEQVVEYEDLTNYFLPEFIGITLDGNRLGISNMPNIVSDFFKSISPALSEILSVEPTPSDNAYWESLVQSSESVYLRFHNSFPDCIVGLFADINTSETKSRSVVNSYVYEMFFIPYSETRSEISVAVRAMDGTVTLYHSVTPKAIFTTDDIKKFVTTYESNFSEFTFNGDTYLTKSSSEPVFLTKITTRKITATSETVQMLLDKKENIDTLMNLFAINPDKLLSTSLDTDGFGHYIDSRGILYVRPSEIEYKSTAEDGLHIYDIIGYTETVEIREYIRAATTLLSEITHINRLFTGMDSDILLHSVSAENGVITLTFRYFFDNIRISECEPALQITFENGILRHAKIYTLAVRNLSTRVKSYYEWWFIDQLIEKSVIFQNVSLVYRNTQSAGVLVAEWSAFAGLSNLTRKQ